ncbi:TRAP transporter permease [Alkalilimnicola ehrlichii MLHE-1]|uniref:TRAP transporter, 4TM/12TM fusion protein n=1 Tax=Alkalilimnicola ehrlichii (strain ATCC BAA-1101 / DSM 17681 / MLHE-1) TaxID=187272 RepID=Q0AA65_ALKEH|nr:TRAP transporter fused permease subunit [Alkalilimnicola ehrlichii]ABI56272.1 TRAP transporter, 4TM/12TM fusion protein [Alkalilimnicola ehrlichii MLHE-1]
MTERENASGGRTTPDLEPRRSRSRLHLACHIVAQCLFYALALYFFSHLSIYYFTGAGGATLLAVTLVPIAVAIAFANDLRHDDLYPLLGPLPATLIGIAYAAALIYAAYYLVTEFENIRIYRVGFWNDADKAAGAIVVALTLEYTRRRYLALALVILLLILYTAYGHLVPGMFQHPGMSWNRILTATSLEISTGVFERLPQLGLTLIGSFMLVLAVLRAFGCIDSILAGSSRLAARSPRLLPQAAVIGSFSVAAVSGSGAANAATTGSATIPVLIRAGFPRVKAAAIETASSLGGQLMPPLMGIAAFLMAEYLRVSYFDVVARGFAPAILYFLGVSVAVYLLAGRYMQRAVTPRREPIDYVDIINLSAYALAVIGLIWLMGVERRAAMSSAQLVFIALFSVLSALFLLRFLWALYHQSGPRLTPARLQEAGRPFVRLIETFTTNTAELTVLLATLGILTATFTITGVPTKVGILLMEMAGAHLALMVLVAFAFGYLVGMGLPVAPTYIIVAVVITPFMIRAGVDPWVAHFFAFLVAVFGELSPPTSVVAAVTSRIAEAPFVRTMISALGMCVPLLILMVGVYTRPALVVEPGWPQLPAFALLLVGTLGTILALQGRYAQGWLRDWGTRLALGLLSAVVVLHPDERLAWVVTAPVLAMVFWGLLRAHRALRARPLEAADSAPA